MEKLKELEQRIEVLERFGTYCNKDWRVLAQKEEPFTCEHEWSKETTHYGFQACLKDNCFAKRRIVDLEDYSTKAPQTLEEKFHNECKKNLSIETTDKLASYGIYEKLAQIAEQHYAEAIKTLEKEKAFILWNALETGKEKGRAEAIAELRERFESAMNKRCPIHLNFKEFMISELFTNGDGQK